MTAPIAAKLRYTFPDQERGTMRCVASFSSKLCDAIPACVVTTVPFSCRPSLYRPRRGLFRPSPMTINGSVRHDKTVSLSSGSAQLSDRLIRAGGTRSQNA
jgi:hypothetical protein